MHKPGKPVLIAREVNAPDACQGRSAGVPDEGVSPERLHKRDRLAPGAAIALTKTLEVASCLIGDVDMPSPLAQGRGGASSDGVEVLVETADAVGGAIAKTTLNLRRPVCVLEDLTRHAESAT